MGRTLSNNKKLAQNTLLLYTRTLLVMVISIYTSRIILDVLGVNDYGIYNVVGGFVSMFSILTGTLTTASQRYIAYELGKQDNSVGKVFSTAIIVHTILALFILVLLESFGLWFVNYKMNIDPTRIFAANCVFQCSVLTFCVTLISIPYNAAIVAYEKMNVFAYFSILEVALKLILIFCLYSITFDSLILYAVLMFLVALTMRTMYSIYCRRKLEDCRFKYIFDKSLINEMLGFSGWNFIGSASGVLNNHGINILINLFFGVSFNAARGLAMQIDNAINNFVQNFMMALNPQITKSFAAGDYTTVNNLIVTGTKIAYFLFGILCLPIFINCDYVLSLWLKEVPDNVSIFVKLGMLYNLCQALSLCLYTTMLATGRIKKYQIIVGGLSLLSFPLTWVAFLLGLPCEWSYYTIIFFSLVCFVARLYLLEGMVPYFSKQRIIKEVIVPLFMVTIPIIFLVYFCHSFYGGDSLFSFSIETVECFVISIIFIYALGMTNNERSVVQKFVLSKIRK